MNWDYTGRGFTAEIDGETLSVSFEDDDYAMAYVIYDSDEDDVIAAIEETDGDPNLMAILIEQLISDRVISPL